MASMTVEQLPTLNATLNGAAALFLVLGWVAIKRGSRRWHRGLMTIAFGVSALFLVSYLYYHFNVAGVTKYEGQGSIRFVYFAILVSHIILAMVVPPSALVAVWHAVCKRYDRHVRITRWLWPVWLYVSVTGVMIYVMLYVV